MIRKLAMTLLLAAPAAAFAQGPYLMFGGASSTTDMGPVTSAYADNGVQVTSKDDNGGRAVIGIGANVNQFLAFEAAYLTNISNKVNGTNGIDRVSSELQHKGLQLAVIGKAPLTPQFSLSVKLSANHLQSDYEQVGTGTLALGNYSEKHTKTHLGYGIGASYQVNDNVGVRLGLERIEMNDVVDKNALNGHSGDFAVDLASLALVYSF
jgi:opacity protein-like surface antigen